jgi:hypothetical protein
MHCYLANSSHYSAYSSHTLLSRNIIYISDFKESARENYMQVTVTLNKDSYLPRLRWPSLQVDEEVVEILYLGGCTEEERSSHKQQLAFVEQPERDETSVRHDYPPSLQYLVAETKSCRGADIRKVIRTEFLGL